MPHVTVKLWPGHSEAEKTAFARSIVEAAAKHLGAEPGWVSVGIEEIPEEDWDEKVFRPEIQGKKDTLYVLCDDLK